MVTQYRNGFSLYYRDNSYNVWNFGASAKMTPALLEAIELLAENMPFSYVSIKIGIESLIQDRKPLDVCIGLGILERNKNKLGLDLPAEMAVLPGGETVQYMLEAADPFQLTRQDLLPLITECERRGKPIQEDIVGRIYISYMRAGRFVHGIGVSGVL